MFSKSTLAKKYLNYLFTAANSKGHGIHSPFVFDFVVKIMNNKEKYFDYTTIEAIRAQLKNDKTVLTIDDYGAGSRTAATKQRTVASIASAALKPKKYAQLMFRIVQYFSAKNTIELGTSLGMTTSYLAKANLQGQVYTFEGATSVAAVAKENFDQLKLENVTQILGNFDNTLSAFLNSGEIEKGKLDFAFIDGNHREKPTIEYFKALLPFIHNDTILIFDDIHWSAGMENAWHYIQKDAATTLTIDLYFIGLVFFRREQQEKEHFQIRF